MKITRTLTSVTLALALFAGSVSPALAYRRGTPPLPTTVMRQREELRNQYADAYSSILENAKMYRGESTPDVSGHSKLARAQQRRALRGYHRQVLGYLRGVDYRVLNIAGDQRRVARGSLPFNIVQTGNASSDNYGNWNWDRTTRRDVRENGHYGCVYNRDRHNVFSC